MGDFTVIRHRRIQRSMFHPRPARALFAEALQKASGTAGEIVGVFGFRLSYFGEKIRQGFFQRAFFQVVHGVRVPQQHAQL